MDPALEDEPSDAELFFDQQVCPQGQKPNPDGTCPEAFPEPFQPPVQLPTGFEGGGISFEGGTIFETPDCFLSLSQIIDKYGVTASQAADIKAQSCSENITDEPTDFPVGFDFGTNLGQPTLESEEQIAACTSCQLFGLNCPICAGTI